MKNIEKKLYHFFKLLIISITTVIIFNKITIYNNKNALFDQTNQNLKASLISKIDNLKVIESNKSNWCKYSNSPLEIITVLNLNGNILCGDLKNHPTSKINYKTEKYLEHIEIIKAIKKNFDSKIYYEKSSDRYSIYQAFKVDDAIVHRYKELRTLKFNLNRFNNFTLLVSILITITLIILFYNNKKSMEDAIAAISDKIVSDNPIKEHSHNKSNLIFIERSINKFKRDITDYSNELYLEKSKLESIINNIKDPIVITNRYNKISLINKMFFEFFIKDTIRSDKIYETSITEAIRDNRVHNAFEKAILKNKTYNIYNFQTELIEDKKIYDIIIHPLLTASGKSNGAVGIFYDKTNIVNLDNMKKEFLMSFSHEIKTPLTSIISYNQILLDEIQKEQIDIESSTKIIKTIGRNSGKLLNILNNIINLSSLEITYKPKLEEIDIEDLINHVVNNIQQSYKDHNIKVKSSINKKRFLGDSILIDQLCTNLLDNAFKYSKKGGEVQINWDEKNTLTIKDWGDGIDKKYINKIFDKFFKKTSSQDAKPGNGLGLAISKKIAELHKAIITVESIQGKETCFKVKFPPQEA